MENEGDCFRKDNCRFHHPLEPQRPILRNQLEPPPQVKNQKHQSETIPQPITPIQQTLTNQNLTASLNNAQEILSQNLRFLQYQNPLQNIPLWLVVTHALYSALPFNEINTSVTYI